MAHNLRAHAEQCIFTRFEKGDFATFEMFIVDAPDDGNPRARVQIEGPVCSHRVGEIDPNSGERTWPKRSGEKNESPSMGTEMVACINTWGDFVQENKQHFQHAGIIHHAYMIDYTHSGESEDAIAARADISRRKSEAIQQIEERARQKKEQQRQRTKEEGGGYKGDENVEDEKYEEEDWGHPIREIVPDEIEPYEWTKPIKGAGWYRMCVRAEKSTITVEMDIRSGADLGGIDQRTGHVYRHDDYEDMLEEKRIMERLGDKEPTAEDAEAKSISEELERALRDQVKDYDLDSTRKLISEVKALVSELQKKHSNVHNRIKGHESLSKRNYRRIVRSGMVETGLYLAITLFQVYTVQKWLLSSNMLGR